MIVRSWSGCRQGRIADARHSPPPADWRLIPELMGLSIWGATISTAQGRCARRLLWDPDDLAARGIAHCLGYGAECEVGLEVDHVETLGAPGIIASRRWRLRELHRTAPVWLSNELRIGSCATDWETQRCYALDRTRSGARCHPPARLPRPPKADGSMEAFRDP